MLSFLTDTVVFGFSLYHILAYFLIYSCIGWCLEVIYAAATTGQLVNRGFLNGPVCPIYGFGMILVLFLLTPLQGSILLLYIGGVILPSALELVGGWLLYKVYHTRWWDYSDFPFNIGGYICLEFCLLWGVGTLVIMRIVHPVIASFVDMIPPFAGLVLMCVLYAVYAADVVVTAFEASGLSKTLDTMEQLADSIHAVSDAMTQLLGTTTLNADNTTSTKVLYDPADDTFAELNRYLHMRFYKQTEGKDGKKKEYTTYAYTTAYPNKDYMGLVVSDLAFYARGWKEEKETGKICMTSLSMQLTVAKPDGTPVYTQTAVIPLPGAPEFQ